jgi:hypothetical protein
MTKKPIKLPVYDPDKDGNPFEWIVQMSARCRRGDINGQGAKSVRLRLDHRTGRAPTRPL